MSKIFLSALFLFFSFVKIEAQKENYADSLKRELASPKLKRELASAKEDTNKVLLLINLSDAYLWSYPDSGILYAQEALQLAQKLNFINGECPAYWSLEEAFSSKGNYPEALNAALKELDLSEKSGDSENLAGGYDAVGSVYAYSNDYERALYYYNKLKLNHAIFLRHLEDFSGTLGQIYLNLNQLDSAFYYTKMCYDADQKSQDHWPIPYFSFGEIYAQKKEYASARDYYHRGINYSIEKKDFLDGYIGIARIFEKMNLVDSAVYYARLAIDVEHALSFPSEIVEASKILTDIYTTSHVTDSTLKYTQIMMVAKDSLFSQAKQNLSFNERLHQQELQEIMEQEHLASRNRQNIIILLSGLLIILIVAIGLWRKNIYKQKSYALLQKQKQEIDFQKTKVENALSDLKSTQAQLIQSEKMASLGELTAGIAHEIQNPLNFVNNFSEVNKELIEELKSQKSKLKTEEQDEILNDIDVNLEKILHHGKRADAIVKGMLQHSRVSTGKKELTDINALCDEYLRLSYYGMRAKEKDFNVKLETSFDATIGKINVVPQDIGRVLLNLINNGFYAVDERKKQGPENFEPKVSLSTKKINNKIQIHVKDNGNGIPQKVLDKIFQPFFTTKPTGVGTGLGLSLSYDIIKAHGGEIKVETKEGEGSEFVIQLPINKES